MGNLAWAHYDLDHVEPARRIFDQMLAIDRHHQDALYGRGTLAFVSDDYDASIAYHERALAQGPTGHILSGLAASRYRADRIDLDEFLRQMEIALALSPNYRWALREVGWTLDANGDQARARDYFERALALAEDDANALYGMATVLRTTGEAEQALIHTNKALAEAPQDYDIRSLRALLLRELKRPKQSLKDAEQLIAQDPDRGAGYVRKAQAMSALGQGGTAINLLRGHVTRHPRDGFALYWLGSYLFDEEEHDEARQRMTVAAGLDSADESDFRLLARIELALGNVTDARRAMDRALAVDPVSQWSLYNNALVLVAEHRFEEAEAEFDRTVSSGLSASELSGFLAALVAQSRFMQAIQMRVRYADRRAAQEAEGD
ncbi:tetratricopeptide repeat protein [Ruegeria sp. XHP0148]|uniref:Tetratricopeptide repeat protein n=2 Tax=Ruegeria aquimaris TaxID=2984333 RepID=A0ABT3AID2_9RHOB|nr:tetratricopeptide repeat protein [Ruegeria sp. XHP0148]